MATIKDVARRAGVSIATVSYVLNGRDRVSAEGDRRVRQAIQAVVGFADDPLAGVMDPGLTTIHYPMVGMGRRAFEVFRSLRDHPRRSVPHERLPTSLVVRRRPER